MMTQPAIEIRREPLAGPFVWTGGDLQNDHSWIMHFTPAWIDEIDRALAGVKARHLKVCEFGAGDFPLPGFARQVQAIHETIETGRGFVMLRGFPVERYSKDDCELIFWGLGAHVGPAVSQNMRGERLAHVVDKGLEFGAQKIRGYETRSRLYFHNDNGDMVGLFCLHPSRTGGSSKIVSTAAVYNEILRRHPEYIDELCHGYHYHMRGEHPLGHGEVTGHRVPVFSYHAGKLSSRYTRNSILLGAQALSQPLTERQRAPLDLLDEVCEALCFTMTFQRGDIQWLSNHAVLHARTDFEDFDEPEKKRDLLRIWLNITGARPLTYEFATRYGPGSARMGVPPVRR